MEKKYFYNIDFLRFIFAIIIVYFHILHSNIMEFISDIPNVEVYQYLRISCSSAGIIVEGFLIIAGFFLFQSFYNHPKLNFLDFAKNKIARLWPVLAFSLILSVIFFKMQIITAIINGCFLQCIGVTLAYKGINWYISSFFWAIIFYFYILKTFDKKYARLIIVLCIYFSIVGNINHFQGSFGRETFANFFNAGLMRALAGIGIGYFIGEYQESLKYKINTYSSKYIQWLSGGVYSAIEILCLYFLISHFLFHSLKYQNQLIFLIVFSTLLICFIKQKGIISKLLNNNFWGWCGKYSYSIYAMQQISFNIMKKSLWRLPDFVNNITVCVTVSLIISILIGILTYYFIELPIGKLIKKQF